MMFNDHLEWWTIFTMTMTWKTLPLNNHNLWWRPPEYMGLATDGVAWIFTGMMWTSSRSSWTNCSIWLYLLVPRTKRFKKRQQIMIKIIKPSSSHFNLILPKTTSPHQAFAGLHLLLQFHEFPFCCLGLFILPKTDRFFERKGEPGHWS